MRGNIALNPKKRKMTLTNTLQIERLEQAVYSAMTELNIENGERIGREIIECAISANTRPASLMTSAVVTGILDITDGLGWDVRYDDELGEIDYEQMPWLAHQDGWHRMGAGSDYIPRGYTFQEQIWRHFNFHYTFGYPINQISQQSWLEN